MKFVSWNVNGLRACVNKGFLDTFHAMNADFFCLQETKLQAGQIELDLPGYEQYWCYAEKKGYSGTAIFTKHTPLSVTYGVGMEELDTEGRLITLEYEEFYLVCCYTPNAQRELARIDHRLRWEAALQEYLANLDSKKPVIYCGDLNVAHNEIDLKNPAANRGNAGFSDEERGAFSALLARGFTDSFRHLYPDVTGAYSWWSYMFNARKNNAGWRIDYFVVSNRLAGNIHDATIHPEVMGSDHCPVGLDLNITCNGSIWTADTTTPNEQIEKKADGDTSAGHIRKLIPIAVSLMLTAALLIPIFALRKPSQEPEPQQSLQATESAAIPVVKDIIVHGSNLSMIYDFGDQPSLSSYLPIYYTNGIDQWELISPDISAVTNPNFFVQLVFDENYLFSGTDLPTITVKNCDATTVTYYYGEDHKVAGCFVSGYAEYDFQLEIEAHYGSARPQSILVSTQFTPALADWTADELFYYIKHSSNLTNWIYSSILPETLVSSNVYAQELATRPEAISILLYDYEYYGDYFSISFLLLTHEMFQSIMTTEEKSQFTELREHKQPNSSGEIIYGSPIAMPI